MNVKAEDFNYIADLVRKQTGIVLEAGKEYLVESRLAPIARREGLGSLQELVARLRVGTGNGLGRRITEALTTNETLFFRDIAVFDGFTKSMMPLLLAKRAQERKLNIWCAACSSGQEPYSLAMLIREELPEVAGWTLRLLASDLSTEMIRRAQAGTLHSTGDQSRFASPLSGQVFLSRQPGLGNQPGYSPYGRVLPT